MQYNLPHKDMAAPLVGEHGCLQTGHTRSCSRQQWAAGSCLGRSQHRPSTGCGCFPLGIGRTVPQQGACCYSSSSEPMLSVLTITLCLQDPPTPTRRTGLLLG